MTAPTISKHSNACLRLLRSICRDLGESSADEEAKSVFRDALGRYKTWAGNVGSLQESIVPTSLEHRLRSAASLNEAYIDLLEDLTEELSRAATLIPNPHVEPAVAEDALTALAELALVIDDTISELFRLTGIVRSLAPRDRFAIAQRRIDDADLPSLEDEGESVGDLFKRLRAPDLQWLQSRLAHANRRRRKFVQYSESHLHQTSKGISASHHARNVEVGATRDKVMGHLQTPSATASVAGRSEFSMPFTSATTVDDGPAFSRFMQSREAPGERPVISDASIYCGPGKLHPMSLDEASAGKEDFECPYCKLLIRMESQQQWHRHVFADLKAYVCTHKDCEAELTLFDSLSAWMLHETQHFSRWQCPYCSDLNFGKQNLLERHLASEHRSNFSGPQLSALAQTCLHAEVSVATSICRFCDWTSEISARVGSAVAVKGIHVPLAEYKRHVGQHLQQIALIVVAAQDDLESDRDVNDLDEDFDYGEVHDTTLEDRGSSGRVEPSHTESLLQHDAATKEGSVGRASRLSHDSSIDLSGIRPLDFSGLPKALESPAVNSLRPVAQAPDSATPAVNVVLVTLPWLLKFDDWFVTRSHGSDISIGNVAIYAFEEWAAIQRNFRWPMLRQWGRKLADCLLAMCRSTTRHSSRPILLMAHSLAGSILKYCLVLMHREHERYRLPRDTVRGVLFMGSPHCSSEDRLDLLNETSTNILKLGGFAGPVEGKLMDDTTLLEICKDFNAISGRLPIVSLHETNTTRFGGRSVIIVDKRLSMIDASNDEILSSINTNHRSIPTLRDENSAMNKFVLRTIQQFVGNAQEDFGVDLDKYRARDPTLPCFAYEEARQRNKDFHGREEILLQLEERLMHLGVVAVVHGIGGVGKSDVALEFAHRHRNQFDAVFWIPADDITKMRQVFAKIAVKLGLQVESEAQDPHNSRELVKAWLANPKKASDTDMTARWLIIFDGADVAANLSEFEPVFGKGSVLITTQDSDLASTIPGPREWVSSIHLGFFEDTDAALLLKKMAAMPGISSDDEDFAAREIVRQYRFGGWPLAISQMARMIRDKYGISLKDFLDVYIDEHHDDLEITDPGQSMMVEALRLASLARPATELLQVCAMLDPDRIQESLFATQQQCAVPLKYFPGSKMQVAQARAELLRTSLMQRNSDKQELWLHRVVRDTVLRRCSDEVFNTVFQSAAALVAHAWKPPGPQLRDNLELWKPCQPLLTHVEHLKNLYIQDLKAHGGSKSRVKASDHFAELLCEHASYKTNIGDTIGVKDMLDLALSVTEDLPETHPRRFDLLCDIYHYLGAWANETNHAQECHDYNSRYLEMRLDAIKAGVAPDEKLAGTYNQYGTGLMMLKRYDDAMDAFQKSIDLYATLAVNTKCANSLPIVNLALARWLTHDYETAWSLLESGLLEREEAFGPEDTVSFRTGRFLHAIGNVKWSQGNFSVSKVYHHRALKQYTKILVNAHHRTADVRHRMAQHFLRENDCERAAPHIDSALRSWREGGDSFRHEIARTTWLKAKQRRMGGYENEAQALEEEAAAMRRQLRPDDQRAAVELVEEDFDELVSFWSR